MLKNRQPLGFSELQELKVLYEHAAEWLPKYGEDDEFEWDEYERFALEKNSKLRDMNRKHVPQIEYVKAEWARSRPKHINFAELNPFEYRKFDLDKSIQGEKPFISKKANKR